MEFKGTKGEWKTCINNRASHRPMVVDNHGCQIASMNELQPDFKANAKLIASAPDLLEALQYILEVDNLVDMKLAKADAEVAILKALK